MHEVPIDKRDRTTALIQQCEHLASEIYAWRRRHACEMQDHNETREQARSLSLQLAFAQATIRNIPADYDQAPGKPCIKCGNPASVYAWFAKAY